MLSSLYGVLCCPQKCGAQFVGLQQSRFFRFHKKIADIICIK